MGWNPTSETFTLLYGSELGSIEDADNINAVLSLISDGLGKIFSINKMLHKNRDYITYRW